MITGYKPATIEKAEKDYIVCYTDKQVVEAIWLPDTVKAFTDQVWLWHHMGSDMILNIFAFPNYRHAATARLIWNKVDKVGPKTAAGIVQKVICQNLAAGLTETALAKLVPGLGPAKAKAVLPFINGTEHADLSKALSVLRAMGIEAPEQLLTVADVTPDFTTAQYVELALARSRI